MLANVRSAAVLGIEAYAVTVEVDAAPGLPGWTMVGLPSGSVKEARERVGAALVNAGFALPPRRWTVNLSPADVRKDGTAFDLPIAIGVLVASGQLDADAVEGLLVAGELGLDGSVRPIRGALPLARAARDSSARALVLPTANAAEAGLLRDVRLAPCDSLAALVGTLRDGRLPEAAVAPPPDEAAIDCDLNEVVGQRIAKRALELAAAGGHNAFLLCSSRPLPFLPSVVSRRRFVTYSGEGFKDGADRRWDYARSGGGSRIRDHPRYRLARQPCVEQEAPRAPHCRRAVARHRGGKRSRTSPSRRV